MYNSLSSYNYLSIENNKISYANNLDIKPNISKAISPSGKFVNNFTGFCVCLQEAKDIALILSTVAGIFYILQAGHTQSLFTVILEFLYKTKVDTRKQNVTAFSLSSF